MEWPGRFGGEDRAMDPGRPLNEATLAAPNYSPVIDLTTPAGGPVDCGESRSSCITTTASCSLLGCPGLTVGAAGSTTSNPIPTSLFT